MNCEEFQHTVLAEPAADSPERRAHAQACDDCAGLQRRVQRLDREIVDALDIAVPASLSGELPSIEALESATSAPEAPGNVVALRPKRSRLPQWSVVTGLAAAVALVAVFVVRPADVTGGQDYSGLVTEVVEHLGPEISTMQVSSTVVGEAALNAVLQPAGVAMTGAPGGTVSYAKSCVINGQLVPHLVVQGEAGPVTVLILPDQHVDGPVSIMQDGFDGVILPVGDGGSIAIIGRDAESVEAVRQRASDHVGFSI